MFRSSEHSQSMLTVLRHKSFVTWTCMQLQEWIALRKHLGLPLDARGASKAETAASMLALSQAQVQNFVRLCAQRYDHKRMDPGIVHLHRHPHQQPTIDRLVLLLLIHVYSEHSINGAPSFFAGSSVPLTSTYQSQILWWCALDRTIRTEFSFKRCLS